MGGWGVGVEALRMYVALQQGLRPHLLLFEDLWNRFGGRLGYFRMTACGLESEAHASLLTWILLPRDTQGLRGISCSTHLLINTLLVLP